MIATFSRQWFLFAACTIVLGHFSTAAEAALIANLNNTGTSGGVALVGAGVADPNYSLIVQPGSATAVTVDDTVPFPILGGPWVPNNAGSRWIGSAANSQGLAGNYTYRTTFTVPANAILSTVNVSGLWGTDDSSIDILINGNSTGNVSAGFASLVPFTVNSGFVFGTNTLDFALNNSPLAGQINPTGLRVDKLVGTFQIPEPGTACLAIVAIIASVPILRRLRPEVQMT